MIKNKSTWILLILIVIGGYFYYSYKKEAMGAGFGYWNAQEFIPTNDIIREVALTIKNNYPVPNPTGGIEIYIASRKEVNDVYNTIVYSYTTIPDNQIDTTKIKYYDIGDAEVPIGQKLYLVVHIVNSEPSPNYIVMTNLNSQSGQYYFSFNGNTWLTNWLDVYDIEFDLVPPNANCNTPADSNCDGCISDIGEWGTAVTNWKTQQGGITDDNWVQIVPKWKSQEGC